jgi:hypothetical protein
MGVPGLGLCKYSRTALTSSLGRLQTVVTSTGAIREEEVASTRVIECPGF